MQRIIKGEHMRSSNIGGQAVIEGIMMRHKDEYAIAVRKPNGEIEIKTQEYRSVFGKAKVMRLPILRGVVSFVDSLVIGTKCLMYSAAFFEEEEEEKDKLDAMTEEERERSLRKQEKLEKLLMTATVVISMLLAVGLFMVLPYVLASLLRKVGATETVVTLVESVVKIALFLAYMGLISRMKDIQRTFMYHGSEHKCINCIENGLDLTVENVMKSSRQHKRCGTSFLLYVMVVSIIFHFFFVFVPVFWVRLVGRLLLIPIIAGVSYEFIQWAGRSSNPVVCWLSKPGLALQKLTTKEPTPDMVEVAIAAVEAVFDWKPYVEEVQKENGENPGEYAKTILELGGTLADIPKAGNRWKQIFLESKDRLNEGEQIPYVLSDIYYKNVRWFNTLRSTLYIMEEDLLIASQPSVNELWNIFFEIEEDLQGNFVRKLKIRETYGKFTEFIDKGEEVI